MLITLSDAVKRLKWRKDKFWQCIDSGQIPSYIFGRRRLVLVSDIERLAAPIRTLTVSI